jgi:hypothetical protein
MTADFIVANSPNKVEPLSAAQSSPTPTGGHVVGASSSSFKTWDATFVDTSPLVEALLTIIDLHPEGPWHELLASIEFTSLLSDFANSAEIWDSSEESLPVQDVLSLLEGLASKGNMDTVISVCCAAWPSLQEFVTSIGRGYSHSVTSVAALLTAYIISSGDLGDVEGEGFSTLLLRILAAGLASDTFADTVKVVLETTASLIGDGKGASSVFVSNHELFAGGLSATTLFAIVSRKILRGDCREEARALLCRLLVIAKEVELDSMLNALRIV